MPLITGSIYIFGQMLSFALPVALLISFATFFYRLGRSAPETAPRETTSPSAVRAQPAPQPPSDPSRPYSDH